MELLKLKAMSSGSSRPKRKEHLHRESLIDHGPDEPSYGAHFISLPVDSAVGTNETITDCAYVDSCSSAITQQAVASTVNVLDSKPILSVGAKNAIPQQRVIIQDDEPLITSRQNADAQCFPMGPVSTDTDGSHVAGVVPGDPMGLETVGSLSSAISKDITLSKRNMPMFDGNPLHYYGFMKSFEETILKQVSDPASQLAYLIDMCRGKAYEVIRFCNIIFIKGNGS